MKETSETNRPNTGIMELAEKLTKLLAERDLPNVAEVARRAKVSRSSCYKWFAGTAWPEIREAFRLAAVLRVPVEYLADDSQDKPPPPPELTPDEEAAHEAYRELRSSIGPVKAFRALSALGPPEQIGGRSASSLTRMGGSVEEEAPQHLYHEDVEAMRAYGTGRVIGERDETEAHLRREREAKRPQKRKDAEETGKPRR